MKKHELVISKAQTEQQSRKENVCADPNQNEIKKKRNHQNQHSQIAKQKKKQYQRMKSSSLLAIRQIEPIHKTKAIYI